MPRAVLSAVVCDGKKSSLWNFDFYYECYVYNASIERNLNHFIVYLITSANLCFVFGARFPTETEQGFFSGFPRMQGGMFVMLCNTIFNYCNYNVYVYIHMWSVHPNIFSVTFYAKESKL